MKLISAVLIKHNLSNVPEIVSQIYVKLIASSQSKNIDRLTFTLYRTLADLNQARDFIDYIDFLLKSFPEFRFNWDANHVELLNKGIGIENLALLVNSGIPIYNCFKI